MLLYHPPLNNNTHEWSETTAHGRRKDNRPESDVRAPGLARLILEVHFEQREHTQHEAKFAQLVDHARAAMNICRVHMPRLGIPVEGAGARWTKTTDCDASRNSIHCVSIKTFCIYIQVFRRFTVLATSWWRRPLVVQYALSRSAGGCAFSAFILIYCGIISILQHTPIKYIRGEPTANATFAAPETYHWNF